MNRNIQKLIDLSKSQKNPIVNSEKNKYQFEKNINNHKRIASAQKNLFLLQKQQKNIMPNIRYDNIYNSNENKIFSNFNNHNEFLLANNNINNKDIKKELFNNNNKRIKRSDPKNGKKGYNSISNNFWPNNNNIPQNLNLLKIKSFNGFDNNQNNNLKFKLKNKSGEKPVKFSEEKMKFQFDNFVKKEKFQINNPENINEEPEMNFIQERNQIKNSESINKNEYEINHLKETIQYLKEKIQLYEKDNLLLKGKISEILSELNSNEEELIQFSDINNENKKLKDKLD